MTRGAFEKVRTNTGQETYRPLEIYMKLKPEDFAAIADEYGFDETVKYIQAMENAQVKGRNNG